MNGRQLRGLFVRFNQQFFGARLPQYSVRAVDGIRISTSVGYVYGICRSKRRIIEIDNSLPDTDAISALLHEMAHAATPRDHNHGKKWTAEMIRLREAGAPLTGSDLNITMESSEDGRISRRKFRDFVDDVLTQCPNVTLKQVIRHHIRWKGGYPTVAEWLRKLPWSRQVFRQCKKDHTERIRARHRLLTHNVSVAG
jgi:hypothetical protein